MKRLNLLLKNSDLFQQADTGKVKFNIPITILIYFALWLIGLALGRLLAIPVINLIKHTGEFTESLSVALRKFIVCGTQIIIFFSWVKFAERCPVKSIGFQGGKPLQSYIIGCIVGICTISAVTAVLVYTGEVKLPSGQIQDRYLIINISILALGWIVQSASEEIAIRGWLIPRLGNRTNPIIAITITAVIFGILHLFSSGVTVLSFVNLTLSGIFFAVYAILNGNIWGTCGLHFAWNFALGNIYGFPVSGFLANGSTVFQAQEIGPAFLTGGSFGPEGGLITTIMLSVAIIALVMKEKRKSYS